MDAPEIFRGTTSGSFYNCVRYVFLLLVILSSSVFLLICSLLASLFYSWSKKMLNGDISGKAYCCGCSSLSCAKKLGKLNEFVAKKKNLPDSKDLLVFKKEPHSQLSQI